MPRPKPRKRPKLRDLSIDPEAISAHEYRTAQFNIKLTERELESIRKMAKRLGVSVSDYLVELHRQAEAAMSRKRKGR